MQEQPFIPKIVADAIALAETDAHGEGFTLMIGFRNGMDKEFEVHTTNFRYYLTYARDPDPMILNGDEIVMVRVAT